MTVGVASLGMYDGGPLAAANDRLWDLIARRLRDDGVAGVPPSLDRGRSLDAIWRDPSLLLAQCCGYPLMTAYREELRYVATPCYDAPGCAGAFHGSHLIVRHDDPAEQLADLRGRQAAINGRDSNTGANLFRATVAPFAGGAPFFSTVGETGSHRASVRAVAEGRADVAAIDAVTFALIARDDPGLAARVRTIGATERVPGLPFVTSAVTPGATVARLRTAIEEVVRSDAARSIREILLIADVRCLAPDTYHRIVVIKEEAARLGYPELA